MSLLVFIDNAFPVMCPAAKYPPHQLNADPATENTG